MYYVYFLRSIKAPNKTYVGYTLNLEDRLKKHNEGGSVYTADHRPWKLVTYVYFDSLDRALAFEKYQEIVDTHKDANNFLNSFPSTVTTGHPDGHTRAAYLRSVRG